MGIAAGRQYKWHYKLEYFGFLIWSAVEQDFSSKGILLCLNTCLHKQLKSYTCILHLTLFLQYAYLPEHPFFCIMKDIPLLYSLSNT